MMTNIHFR